MKSFVCAILIFAVILTGAAMYTQALSVETERLCNHLFLVEYYITSENWTACLAAFETLKKEWAMTEKWLKAIVGHRELDQIQMTLCEMQGYILVKNKDEATVKAGVLRLFFRLLPANESLSFVNIL